MEDIKVKITAYRGYIVVEPTSFNKDKDFIPVTEVGQVGSLLSNTLNRLGISKEAVKLMKTVKRCNDSIGDISYFKARDTDCFYWLGSLYGMFKADSIELPKHNKKTMIKHITIANEPPEGAINAIDNIKQAEAV